MIYGAKIVAGKCGNLWRYSIRAISAKAMDLTEILQHLSKLSPLHNAATWDNVGLLVEPSAPHSVTNVMLTNDLTEAVLQEGIESNVDMIISYHPPIFKPLKRLTMSTWKERIIVKSIENRIAIYSPHTACDAVTGGVNDWLVTGLGKLQSCKPIINSNMKLNEKYHVTLTSEVKLDECSGNILESKFNATKQKGDNNTIKYGCRCSKSSLQELIDFTSDRSLMDCAIKVKIVELTNPPLPGTGMGRICILRTPITLSELLEKIKKHLSIPHVRLAIGNKCDVTSMVKSVALCAGSGASVLQGVKADVYLTGEMSHHEVLDAASNGVSVVLCEHSNTERGYLLTMKEQLEKMCKNGIIKVMLSLSDKDPLKVY